MSRRASLFVALAAALLVTGCATVPEESQAVAVQPQELGQIVNPDVEQPDRDLDPLTVARDFVRASAQPVSNNATARTFLDDAAAKAWSPGKVMNVIDDQFNTVYAPVAGDPNEDPNEKVVVVRGTNLGVLNADSSFIPSKAPYELRLVVRKQADGQWRLTNPPANIVMPYSDFTANYSRVPVYFFAQDSNTIVPDLRYVAAKPQTGLAQRVVQLLLSGPSDQLVGAVRSPLPEDAGIEGTVTTTADGLLLVPLTGVADQPPEVKKLIAAQIVLSLQAVTTNRVRLLSDGTALVDGREDWLPTDVPSYTALASPGADQSGLMTVNGRIRSLADGSLVPGPVGLGSYDVVSAAQSIDGRQLAIVDTAGGRQELRIGTYGAAAQPVGLAGGVLTRPTWRPTATADGTAGEVWTVVDGSAVVRVLRTSDGSWNSQAVNAEEVLNVGPISVLRLSRDGARAAMVVNGQLMVASVVRTQDSVTLKQPRILQTGSLVNVVDVDWLSQDSLVAATSMPSQPVVKVPIDGLRLDTFNSSNLTPPVYAITAAPGRPIVVADAGGLWTASDVGEVWRPHPHTLQTRVAPFYPG